MDQALWGQNSHRGAPQERKQWVSSAQACRRGCVGSLHPETCPGHGAWPGPGWSPAPRRRASSSCPQSSPLGLDAPASLLSSLVSSALSAAFHGDVHGYRGSALSCKSPSEITVPSSHAFSGLRAPPSPPRPPHLDFYFCNIYRHRAQHDSAFSYL